MCVSRVCLLLGVSRALKLAVSRARGVRLLAFRRFAKKNFFTRGQMTEPHPLPLTTVAFIQDAVKKLRAVGVRRSSTHQPEMPQSSRAPSSRHSVEGALQRLLDRYVFNDVEQCSTTALFTARADGRSESLPPLDFCKACLWQVMDASIDLRDPNPN